MGKKNFYRAGVWLGIFVVGTLLLRTVDVRCIGETGRAVGLATVNGWFHQLTGVHRRLYVITDWLGLVPIFVCAVFGCVGLRQWMQRKRLWKVDRELRLLGVYYVLVIVCYLVFEKLPVNYRPVLIEGRLEASYPSSTTLLVLSVMPTLAFEIKRRVKKKSLQKLLCMAAGIFSAGMVLGRLVSGVHWLTDIIGAVALSRGLFCLFKGFALWKNGGEVRRWSWEKSCRNCEKARS